MSREIKFRVWFIKDECMAAVKGNPINHNLAISFDGKICDFRKIRNPIKRINSTVLMQFTGLKDKNGKEIYEGDIIAYLWEDREGDAEIINHVIRWDKGKFLMCPIKSNMITWNLHVDPYCEESDVIGNIYENPDLLNSEK